MIAWWLRFCLMAGAAAAVLVGMVLSDAAGMRPIAAAMLAVIIVVALATGSIAVKYAISRLHAYVPPQALAVPLWRVVAAAVSEALAFCFIFGIVQPFPGWWMGSEALGRIAPGRT